MLLLLYFFLSTWFALLMVSGRWFVNKQRSQHALLAVVLASKRYPLLGMPAAKSCWPLSWAFSWLIKTHLPLTNHPLPCCDSMQIVLFAFGSWQTLSLVLWLLLIKLAPEAWGKARLTLPLLGRVGLLQLVSGATAAAVAGAWFVWRHSHWAWALQDVLGISLMLVILQQLRLPNLRVACILLPLAFLVG